MQVIFPVSLSLTYWQAPPSGEGSSVVWAFSISCWQLGFIWTACVVAFRFLPLRSESSSFMGSCELEKVGDPTLISLTIWDCGWAAWPAALGALFSLLLFGVWCIACIGFVSVAQIWCSIAGKAVEAIAYRLQCSECSPPDRLTKIVSRWQMKASQQESNRSTARLKQRLE